MNREAGPFGFSAGRGLVATHCVNAFSYGCDKPRFIKPTFVGDAIHAIRAHLERRPKYRDIGLTRASCEALMGDGGLVLHCERLRTVEYRGPAACAAEIETPS